MPEPVLNNPYELGAPDFDLLRAALDFLASETLSSARKARAKELLRKIETSHSIWLDLDE